VFFSFSFSYETSSGLSVCRENILYNAWMSSVAVPFTAYYLVARYFVKFTCQVFLTKDFLHHCQTIMSDHDSCFQEVETFVLCIYIYIYIYIHEFTVWCCCCVGIYWEKQHCIFLHLIEIGLLTSSDRLHMQKLSTEACLLLFCYATYRKNSTESKRQLPSDFSWKSRCRGAVSKVMFVNKHKAFLLLLFLQE